MLSKTKNKSVVGLDIEAGSVAATELRANGQVELTGHGTLPLAAGVFREGEVGDPDALAGALKELFAEHKLGRAVRLGVANQRVAVRTLSLPVIEDRSELETAIRFQAQDHIPMPLEQAVIDWQVVPSANGAEAAGMSVVVVAARRDMLEGSMEAMRRAGLRPVGIDHSAFGMIRALAHESHPAIGAGSYVDAPAHAQAAASPEPATAATAPMDAAAAMAMDPAAQATAVQTSASQGSEQPEPAIAHPARLYCNFGDVTNLAVARGSICLFTRVASFGVEGIAQKLAERRRLTLEHARQWLVHVGLESPTDAIEGDPEVVTAAREALGEGAAKLADELRLSLEFYGAQEDSVAVEGVVACGPGTTIPGLVERLQRDLGHRFEVGRPRALGHLDDGAAARLTLSYGLALED